MRLSSLALPAILSAVVFLGACASTPSADTLLDQSLAGPQRSEANKARDAARHPKETLLFFGLRPDQKVIEIAPGRRLVHRSAGPRAARQGRALRGALPA